MRWRPGHYLTVALLAAFVVGAIALAGHRWPFGPTGGPYPAACGQWGYDDHRCDAIVRDAARQAGTSLDVVAAVDLLPFEQQATLGGQMVARVSFRFADGRTIEQDVWCTGVGARPACPNGVRTLGVNGVVGDVPCWGEPPDACATPPPTPRPASVDASQPLVVTSLDVPVDRAGSYEIHVGTATLPDGYLSEQSVRVADPDPSGFWIERVDLVIRSEIPGRPEAGWRYRDPYDGPEPVRVFVAFEIDWVEEPGLLQLRDIIVR